MSSAIALGPDLDSRQARLASRDAGDEHELRTPTEPPPPASGAEAVAAQRDGDQELPPRASQRLVALARRLVRARHNAGAATDSIDAVLAGIRDAVELADAPPEPRLPSGPAPNPADTFLACEGAAPPDPPSASQARAPALSLRQEVGPEKEGSG